MYLPNIFEEWYVKKYGFVQVMAANSTHQIDKIYQLLSDFLQFLPGLRGYPHILLLPVKNV
jgi:hypothetical protein